MSGWKIGGGSVRGPAHIRANKPNQDAIGWTPPGGLGERIVGAVADGHGAALHHRSEVGSRLAVETAIELMSWELDDAEDTSDSLASEITALWRGKVDAHLAGAPLEAGDGARYIPYGATLLALGATADQLIALQIGDGDLFFGYADGRVERALASDEGLVGEQTYSLCMGDAEQRFRISLLWRTDDRPLPDFVMLSTDGVSKSFRDEAMFGAAIASLRSLAQENWERTLAALPSWLEDVTGQGSGDDATLCMAVRRIAEAEKGGQ